MTDRISEQGDCVIVALDGDVDLDRAPEVRSELLDCVGRGRNVLVDLSRVAYIDSSGIASLVEALQYAAKNGTMLALIAVSSEALKVFKLARLDKVFSIYPDLEAALAGSR